MENGYIIDKYLIPKLRLRCAQHNKENVQSVCLDISCAGSGSTPTARGTPTLFMCNQCKLQDEQHQREHKQSIKGIDKFVSGVTIDIENHLRGNKSLLEEVFASEKNHSLQKWYHDGDVHMKKVEDHLGAQKLLIAEDISTFMNSLAEACAVVKHQLYTKLDEFQALYHTSFVNYRELLEENFSLAKDFQYYQNSNVLVAKLQSEPPQRATEFVGRLRRAIERARTMNANRSAYLNTLKKMSTNLNTLTDNLPNYNFSESFDPALRSVQRELESFFSARLHLVGDVRELSVQKEQFQSVATAAAVDQQQQPNAQAANRKQAFQYSILNDNKNLSMQVAVNSAGTEDVILKPIKKFQLDIPVTAMTALSDIHLALASPHDNKVRIFESVQKKLQQIAAHTAPVTYLTKLITEERFVNPAQQQQSNNNSTGNFSTAPDEYSSTPTIARRNSTLSVLPAQALQQQQQQQAGAQPQPPHQKKVLLVTCSQDSSIALWTFDYEMKQLPQQYQRLTFAQSAGGAPSVPVCAMDLQDLQCIVAGDASGELSVWDYHRAKSLGAWSGKHHARIVGLNLIRKYERFVAASEDSTITIWKMTYKTVYTNGTAGHYPETFVCEQLVHEPQLGSISALAITVRDLPLLFVGNTVGHLKLFNYDKRKIIAETIAHTSSRVLDLSLIECGMQGGANSASKGALSMSLLSLGLGDKYLRVWRVQRREGEEEFVYSGLKLDVAILNDDTLARSKLQILKGFAPKFVIASEKSKELLVYEISSTTPPSGTA